jgi:branched-chain amino acid transport system substrate-binding protein
VGEETSNAIKLQTAKFNADPEYPVRLEVLFEDDKGDITEAMAVATKYVESEKVNAILGPFSTPNAMATTEYLEGAKIPNITLGAAGDDLTQRGMTYYFRINGSNNMQVRFLIKWATVRLGWQNAVVINANTDHSAALADMFELYGASYGMEIKDKFNFEAGMTDFYSIISKLQTMEFDGIYFCGMPEEVANLAQQCFEQGIPNDKIICVGSDIYKVLELDGETANGLMANVNYDNVNPADDIGKAFLADYSNAYDRNPTMYAAQGCAISDTMFRAIGKAYPNADGTAIRNALIGNIFEDTIFGTVDFDDTNESFPRYMMIQINNGAVEAIDMEQMDFSDVVL